MKVNLKKATDQSKKRDEMQFENKLPPKKPDSNQQKKAKDKYDLEGDNHSSHISPIENNQLDEEKGGDDDKNSKMILIEKRPREEFLQNKMNNMKISPQIIKGVTSDMDRSLDAIKINIRKKELEIKQIPSNVNDILQRVNSKKTNQMAPNYHLVQKLKANENYLQNNLFQLTQRQRIIEDESPNISSSIVPVENYFLRKSQLKEIKETKEDLISKIDAMNYQIEKLVSNEDKSTFILKKKQKIKDFIENMERDREVAEMRMRKYEQESRKRKEKMNNDLKQSVQDKIKAFELKEKESIDFLIQKQKEKREAEKELIAKRIEINKSRLIKIKPYINELPPKKEDNKKDLYVEFPNRYLLKEEKILQTECNKRKQRAVPITHEDFSEFKYNHDSIEEKIKQKCEEDTIRRQEEWLERKEQLPSYHNDTYLQYETQEHKEKVQKRKEKLALKAGRESYALQIVQPAPSIKKRIARRNNIRKLLQPMTLLQNKKRNKIQKRTKPDFKHKKKIIKLRKKNPNKPSRFKWTPKLNPKEFEIKKDFIKKPVHLNLAKSFDKPKRINTSSSPIITDYLKEFREKKDPQSRFVLQKKIRWNKIINDKDNSITNKVNYIKMKASQLDQQAKYKEQFLKLNGGTEKYPELGAQAANLIVDSIKAKLSILEKVS